MSQDEERLTESNSNINTTVTDGDDEVPAKRFAITMEFPLFVVMMGMSLSGAAINNIFLYRTCVHSLGHSEDECHVFLSLDKSNQTRELEEAVQKYATTISTVRSVIEAVVPAILSFYLGGWSDTHGRKPLVVWSLFGITVSSMVLTVYCVMDNLGPWWFIATVIPYSLTGGFTIFFTGAFCYLSDITNRKNRSLRMTIMEASVSAGSVVGSLLSAPVLRLVGNTYLILIAVAMNVVAYVYANIWIPESLTGAVQGGITTVLDFLLVKEMFRECFKKRPNKGRAQILLLTVANSLSIFILYGQLSLVYLYSREKLHWAVKEYTLYSASATTLSFVGSFIGLGLFQKLFRLSDLVVTNVSFLSSIVEYIIKAFAFASWHMYLGAGVAVFNGLSSPLIRSFLTKIMPVEDIAKVFALMSAIEGVCPLIAPLMYNSLYQYTLSSFPGAIFILSSGITAVCFICILSVQYLRWNVSSPYQPLPATEST